MLIKNENGMTAIDIAISVIVITIFIALIANLIASININSENLERETIATSYAVQEIETIKAKGIANYVGLGIDSPDIKENDIYVTENEEERFSGYHKKITIEDYVYLKNDETKTEDLVKKATVEVSYKVKNKDKNVTISTYIY